VLGGGGCAGRLEAAVMERLRKVRAKSELRAGMLVKVVACGDCGRDEQFMLLRFFDDFAGECEACGESAGWTWEGAGCRPEYHSEQWCGCVGIADGRVFIVETGLEDTQTTTKAKPRKRERTRG
jgi:hypothetical protein